MAALGLAPSFDTCGFFARDGETFARVGDVLLGDDPAPLPDPPRLLLAAGAFAALDSDVRGALAPIVKRIEDLLGQAKVVEPAPEGVETLARRIPGSARPRGVAASWADDRALPPAARPRRRRAF